MLDDAPNSPVLPLLLSVLLLPVLLDVPEDDVPELVPVVPEVGSVPEAGLELLPVGDSFEAPVELEVPLLEVPLDPVVPEGDSVVDPSSDLTINLVPSPPALPDLAGSTALVASS